MQDVKKLSPGATLLDSRNILGKRREKLSEDVSALVARNQTAQFSVLPADFRSQPPRGFEPCMLFLKHHPENVGSPQCNSLTTFQAAETRSVTPTKGRRWA